MIIEKQLSYNIVANNENTIQDIVFKIHSKSINSMHIVHRATIQQLTEKRYGNACTKTRSQVKGGGRKPWKQKGTGKARAGSTRSPLWKGGGVIFGPKTKKYTQKINKKEKHLALRIVLVNKFKNTTVIDNFIEDLSKPSTQTIVKQVMQLGLEIKNKNRIAIIVDKKARNLYLSVRNLKNINLIAADQLNILSLLEADQLVVTKNGLNQIAKLYGFIR
uniref:Large ribosomal subunit protein uL4c n=1 Tax=Rhodymenia pseudopalmata TaxID=31502 RepID=A0A1C9C7X1_RHOPU|nr:ribosomal protein L4 [Rhodymenia pseudopalmata]AOM64478.1 ribosomal protein L4 [Rhodymenia pseudopalmata]